MKTVDEDLEEQLRDPMFYEAYHKLDRWFDGQVRKMEKKIKEEKDKRDEG